jgi:HEAT repeat protein
MTDRQQLRTSPADRLRELLGDPQPSVRLQAALSAGMQPDADFVEILVNQSAVDPDFYVRDMVTWALTRHPAVLVVPQVLDELRSEVAQARSQALHTLSKLGESRGWSAVTAELLYDPNDDVARSAWRAAVALVPKGAEVELAERLATQLGRGDRDLQVSLSRALGALGDASLPALRRAVIHGDAAARSHALLTEHLLRHPDDSYEAAIFEADRIIALMGAPTSED